ncbi:hypothetical protein G4177_14660 [Corallococcus sp. ZKHCc1 1396]|uniref:Lipoprotein n=1 Tax=Corallococcus soli TaxID=2710757 RepID=A0ABR9PNF2_9BACT|nr:hypothetical protein [Corallococcus soli]MBE4749407.1 hypothetical protein [Corallococcus soli]
MTGRSLIAAIAITALASACGGTSESEYRITRGEGTTLVIEHEGVASTVTPDKILIKDGTTGKVSTIDVGKVSAMCCTCAAPWNDPWYICQECAESCFTSGQNPSQ